MTIPIELPAAGPLVAEVHETGWTEGDSAYHALTSASNGKVYFSVGSHLPGQSARVFEFSPASGSVRDLWSVDQTIQDDGSVPQSKIHSPMTEWRGELYAATHSSWYIRDHTDPTTGRTLAPYRGGHVIAVDMKTGKGRRIAAPFKGIRVVGRVREERIPMHGEGIIGNIFDTARGQLYVTSWPGGRVARVDVASGAVRQYGPRQGKAETVPQTIRGPFRLRLPHRAYRRALRTLALDPEGNVYGSSAPGRIWRYNRKQDRIVAMRARVQDGTELPVPACLRYLNLWRTIVWADTEKVFYGVHWATSWLFRFDPTSDRIEPVGSWRANHARSKGSNTDFAQLGLAMGPGQTLWGWVHAPPLKADIRRSVHLLSYDLESRVLSDHGPAETADGRALMFAQSCAVSPEGDVYAVGWMEVESKDRERLRALRMGGPSETRGLAYRVSLVRIPAERVLGVKG